MSRPQVRVVVLGYIIRGPVGGLAWHHLQYVDGLARLGYDVRFIEDSDDFPGCYDPSRHVTDCDPSFGISFAADAFSRLGLSDHWSYYDAHLNRWMGAPGGDEFCRSADVVLNISGMNPLREWTERAPVRAFIDTDPLFTQVRNLTAAAPRLRAAGHNVFLSFGENFGKASCKVPDDGFAWIPTRQPIVISRWSDIAPPHSAPYTTVMQWESYPAVTMGGQSWGAKAASFGPFVDLPSEAQVPLEIALGGEDAPREILTRAGWRVTNPLVVADTPLGYQEYIRRSRGEVTVAKHGYVTSNCGWFSERSAAYLASGRPVVTQDTGFAEWLPSGSGVLAFRNRQELLESLVEVERDYDLHRRRARQLAEQFFDSDGVLTRLMSDVARNPPSPAQG